MNSIFSFYHNVLYPFVQKLHHLRHTKLSSAYAFSLDKGKSLLSVKGLNDTILS